jgi:hypothetical protein
MTAFMSSVWFHSTVQQNLLRVDVSKQPNQDNSGSPLRTQLDIFLKALIIKQ